LDSHLPSLGIRRFLFDVAREELDNAGMSPGMEFYKEAKTVLARILGEGGAITYRVYLGIVGDAEVAKEMLRYNVFAYRISDGIVTFQSKLMQGYCEEEALATTSFDLGVAFRGFFGVGV
jgi:hypothetical protein